MSIRQRRGFWDLPDKATALEQALTAIVRGQCRSYFHDHPGLLAERERDLAVSGITKRIVRDLACGSSSARLAPLFVDVVVFEQGETTGVESTYAPVETASVETTTAEADSPVQAG